MRSNTLYSKLLIIFLASRPKFLTASAAPILVGTAIAYATTGHFNPILFILAMISIMALHSGANVANDYFDHTSKNDWVNQNTTPFSGGRRFIQQGILSPKATLLTSFLFLAFGSAVGIVIVLLTQSLFILVLGIAGLLGGFFYTASPVRFGYRGIGELVIMLQFGLLPVSGAYYLQTQTFDTIVFLPAVIVGILIFLVIFINEFPDAKADAAVNKKTLVVCFGIGISVWIYRLTISASYILAAAAILLYHQMFFAGLFYLFTLPLMVISIKFANKKDLATPGVYKANAMTVLLHATGCLALTLGFIVSAFRNSIL